MFKQTMTKSIFLQVLPPHVNLYHVGNTALITKVKQSRAYLVKNWVIAVKNSCLLIATKTNTESLVNTSLLGLPRQNVRYLPLS
jgi:hypothetical protein